MILGIGISVSGYGQERVEVDIVYLKTDTILKGHIIDSLPGVSITLKTLERDYRFIPLDEIEQIKQETYIRSHRKLIPMPPDSLFRGCYYWFWLQGGVAMQVKDHSAQQAQMYIINGIRIRKMLGIGVGLGARFSGFDNPLVAPAYLYLQTTLTRGKIAPVVALGGGTAVNTNLNWMSAGAYFRTDIGIQIDLETQSFFTFTVGYEQLNFHVRKPSYDFGVTKPQTVNNLTLNAGFMF